MLVLGRAGDLEAYLRADLVFHHTLLEASGNEMLQAMAEVVTQVLAGRTHHGLMPSSPNPQAIALHEAVAQAVRSQDAAGAEVAMRAIIDESAAAMRAEFS
jgi:DNA-binding FadR family transcriptional regulator